VNGGLQPVSGRRRLGVAASVGGLVLLAAGSVAFLRHREDATLRATLRASVEAAVAAPVQEVSPEARRVAERYAAAIGAFRATWLEEAWLNSDESSGIVELTWENVPPVVSEAMEVNADALAALAAANPEGVRPCPLDLGPVGPALRTTMLLAARMRVHRLEDRRESLVEDALLLFRMERDLGPGNWIVRWAMVERLSGAVGELTEVFRASASPPDLVSRCLEALPSEGDLRDSFEDGAGEGYGVRLDDFFLGELDTDGARLRSRGMALAAAASRGARRTILGVDIPWEAAWAPSWGFPGPTLATRIGEALALAARYRTLAGLRGPEGLLECVRFQADVDSSRSSNDAVEIIFTGRDPGPEAWLRAEWDLESRLALLRTALAVRLFEARNGRTPASLEDPVPAFLPALPRDPFTGKPPEYQAQPGGWGLTGTTWTTAAAGFPGGALTRPVRVFFQAAATGEATPR